MIKVACHVHSEWSYDAKWPLADIAKAFRKRGYRVVMTTEHDLGFTEKRRQEHHQACADASSESLLVVPGIEYSDTKNLAHVLVWGNVPFLGEGLPTTELLQKVQDAGGLAVLAHPSRKEAWKVFDPDWVSYLLGIEYWNRKTDGWAPSPDAPALLNDSGLKRFVGLDFHNHRQFFPLAMMMDTDGPVSEASILAGLKASRCQPSAFGLSVSASSMQSLISVLRTAEFFRRRLALLRRSISRKYLTRK